MRNKNAAANLLDDAARMGFNRRRMPPDFRRVVWFVKCTKCPQEFTANWPSNMAPEAMARHVRVRHWDVGYGMRPLCPICAHGKDKRPATMPEHQTFDRWIPPQTLIFDRILDAAHTRATEARREEAKVTLPVLLDEIKVLQADIEKSKEERRRERIAKEQHDRDVVAHERMKYNMKLQAQRKADLQSKEAKIAAIAKHRATGPEIAHAEWVRRSIARVYPDIPAPQAPQENEDMATNGTINPTPKITHAVFQHLDDVFDAEKRLYKAGYTDQRVAKDCGTTEEIVAYLRYETFGQLAEDPRYSAMRDDIELLRMESAETFAKLQKNLGELQSRLEQAARSKS